MIAFLEEFLNFVPLLLSEIVDSTLILAVWQLKKIFGARVIVKPTVF